MKVIADTKKQTDKAKLKGKHRQLQMVEIVGALFFNLLEPAKMLTNLKRTCWPN